MRNQHHRPTQVSDLVGKAVSVVQKHDQGTGRLTNGVVSEVLTNSCSHPRGMKVRLTDGTVGRISNGNDNINDFDGNAGDTAFEYAPRPGPSLADFMTPLAAPPTTSITATRTTNTNTNTSTTLSESTQKSEWPCQICTFVNSGLLSECEMCQTVRDGN
jgi:uncharacterized repeat protein (TIGR03833 family)